jgi:SAM-dependent methyltransferase
MSESSTGRYDQAYFQSTYGVAELKPFSQHWWSVRFYVHVSARLLKRCGGRRFLDVGCGFGFILSQLEDRYETCGFDISDYAIEQAQRVAPKSTCRVANLEEGLPAEFLETPFDVVLACYVLEHIKDPRAAVQQLADLVRPGGYLFFSVPNTESIGARWKGDAWYALQDPTHCSLLPPDKWVEFAHAAGLDITRETSDGYWDLPYVSWLPRWLQMPIFLGPSALTCALARPILPARFGENVIIIARKPEAS